MEHRVISTMEEMMTLRVGSSVRVSTGANLIISNKRPDIPVTEKDQEFIKRASPITVLWEPDVDMEYEEIREGGYSEHGVPVAYLMKQFSWESKENNDDE